MELKALSRRVNGAQQDPTDVRATVVIADTGATASVVVIESPQRLTIGSRFRHQGSDWRITRKRPHSRAFVAEPIET